MITTSIREFVSPHRQEIGRFLKFATVGVLGAITHFTILNILVRLVGLSPIASNPFGFIAAVLQNFMLNRRWTFPESRVRDAKKQLTQFVLVSVTGLLINQLIFTIIYNWSKPLWVYYLDSAELGDTLSYNFALLCAIGIVLAWNFSANRLWTYRGL